MDQDEAEFKHEKLFLDYKQTNATFRMLADIRFKLLAFVPALTGAAIALLTKQNIPKEISLAGGFLGFFATLGIVIYELRNTQFYNAAISRARFLEETLGMSSRTNDRAVGGLFKERPGRNLKLFGIITVWHDRGLSLVYGSAIGGWLYIILDSILVLLNKKSTGSSLASAIITAFIAFLFMHEFTRLSG